MIKKTEVSKRETFDWKREPRANLYSENVMVVWRNIMANDGTVSASEEKLVHDASVDGAACVWHENTRAVKAAAKLIEQGVLEPTRRDARICDSIKAGDVGIGYRQMRTYQLVKK